MLGVVPQAQFLSQMGIMSRIDALLANPDLSEEEGENLISSATMLVDDEQMGDRFKVMGFVNWENEEIRKQQTDQIPGFINYKQ